MRNGVIFFLQFSVPIYLIQLDFERQLIFARLFDPINISGEETWEVFEFESSNGVEIEMFPTGEDLMEYRRLLDYDQNLFRLPMNVNWKYTLENFDCEDHRYALSTGTECFVAFGPLQVLQRKMNFTFSSNR